MERAKVCRFKLHGDAAVLLIFRQNARDKAQIAVQVGGKLIDLRLLHISAQHFFLQGNVDPLVGIAGGELVIIKGKKKRVHEEDPAKAFGIEIIGHGDPVGDGGLDS